MTLSIVIVLASYRLGLSIAFTAAYLVLLARGQPYVRQLSDARVNAARYSASSKEVNWLLAVRERISRRRTSASRSSSRGYPIPIPTKARAFATPASSSIPAGSPRSSARRGRGRAPSSTS